LFSLVEDEAIVGVGLLTGDRAQSSYDKSGRLMQWINWVSEEGLLTSEFYGRERSYDCLTNQLD